MITQIGEFTYSKNEHGATIERGVFAPATLPDGGRCCGRKPLEYKRQPDHHFFCTRCARDYLPNGRQRPNWAYKLDADGNYTRDLPLANGEGPF